MWAATFLIKERNSLKDSTICNSYSLPRLARPMFVWYLMAQSSGLDASRSSFDGTGLTTASLSGQTPYPAWATVEKRRVEPFGRTAIVAAKRSLSLGKSAKCEKGQIMTLPGLNAERDDPRSHSTKGRPSSFEPVSGLHGWVSQ
jgi:hypothetical protein